jgi:hypothetical protein
VTAPDDLSHLTVGEAAPILGMSPASVRRLCGRGILTGARRRGRDWEIPAASVHAYAAADHRPGRPRLRPASDELAELRGLGERMMDARPSGPRSFAKLADLVALAGAGQRWWLAQAEQHIYAALASTAPSSRHWTLVQEAAELLRQIPGEGAGADSYVDPVAGSDHELAAARQHQRRASQFRDLADAVFEAASLLDHVLARDERDLRAGPPPPGTVAAKLAEANAELRARAHAGGIAVGVLRQLAEEEELAALAVLRGERAGPSTGVLRQLDMLARSSDGARQREALRGLMDALYDAGHDGLADLVATATS